MSEPQNTCSLWPLGIILFFGSGLTFIIIFVAWACHLREDLVANDYYDNEIRYQQEIDRLNRTQSIAAQVVVTYDAAQQNIVITLPVISSQNTVGQVRLYRPSDERLDLNLPLTLDAHGVERFDTKALAPGLWKIRVHWNTGGQDYSFDRPVIVANPI